MRGRFFVIQPNSDLVDYYVGRAGVFFRRTARLLGLSQITPLELGRWGVLVIVVVLVTMRVFTETLAVLPRYLNGVELGLIPALAGYVLFVRGARTGRIWTLNIELWLAAFGGVWLLSSLLNAADVLPAATLLFIVGHVAPILFALAIVNVDPGPVFVARVFRLMRGLALVGVAFGLTQVPAVASEPDAVVLTFGINQNQAAFFMALMMTWLAARWFCGLADRVDKALLLVLAPLFFLAGFKILWVLYPLSLIVVVTLVLVRRLRLIARVALPAAVLAGLGLAVVRFVPYSEVALFNRFATFDPYELGKVQVLLRMKDIWFTRPWGPLIGVGPGAFSSQAFTTFASIPTAGGIGYLSGREVSGFYMTDVAAQYMLPYLHLGQYALGSSVVSRPTASIISLPAETGMFGSLAIAVVYGATLLRLVRGARRAVSPESLALSLTAAVCLLMLVLISLLDNYLEVSRVTSLVWLMIGLAIGLSRSDALARRGALAAS
jgi:hypothetical protein